MNEECRITRRGHLVVLYIFEKKYSESVLILKKMYFCSEVRRVSG